MQGYLLLLLTRFQIFRCVYNRCRLSCSLFILRALVSCAGCLATAFLLVSWLPVRRMLRLIRLEHTRMRVIIAVDDVATTRNRRLWIHLCVLVMMQLRGSDCDACAAVGEGRDLVRQVYRLQSGLLPRPLLTVRTHPKHLRRGI